MTQKQVAAQTKNWALFQVRGMQAHLIEIRRAGPYVRLPTMLLGEINKLEECLKNLEALLSGPK